MEELLKNTPWIRDEKESGIYFEQFHESKKRGRVNSYTTISKLEDVLVENQSSRIKLFYSDSLVKIEKIQFDLLVREHSVENDCKNKLGIVIKNGTEIHSINFEIENPEDEVRSFWGLSFKDDYSTSSFRSTYTSGPGWPINIKFKNHVEYFSNWFEELEEHYPNLKEALKKALNTLNQNGLDYEGDSDGIVFNLKK